MYVCIHSKSIIIQYENRKTYLSLCIAFKVIIEISSQYLLC